MRRDAASEIRVFFHAEMTSVASVIHGNLECDAEQTPGHCEGIY